MNSKRTNPKVDDYIEDSDEWRQVLAALRVIALDCGLTEEMKWGKPCYTIPQGNILILQPFKDACALMFFNGALLEDPAGVLEVVGPNSLSTRRIKFRDAAEVAAAEPALRSFIAEAVALERAGKQVDTSERSATPVPEELQSALDADPALAKAFSSLSPGRQRGYLLHISGAKQSATRSSRVEKCIPGILAGKGINE